MALSLLIAGIVSSIALAQAKLDADTFSQLQKQIRPQPGESRWLELPWQIDRLWKSQSVVGPGGACTHAATTFLKNGDWTTCGAAVGQAGNGTAMRTAVVGAAKHGNSGR